jgi:ribosomal protein S27E
MRNYKVVKRGVEDSKLESITCDICGKTYDVNNCEDIYEIQEFHNIYFNGGYGSVFGDGDRIECDICQNCLFKMIDGKYRINPEESY